MTYSYVCTIFDLFFSLQLAVLDSVKHRWPGWPAIGLPGGRTPATGCTDRNTGSVTALHLLTTAMGATPIDSARGERE